MKRDPYDDMGSHEGHEGLEHFMSAEHARLSAEAEINFRSISYVLSKIRRAVSSGKMYVELRGLLLKPTCVLYVELTKRGYALLTCSDIYGEYTTVSWETAKNERRVTYADLN